MPKAISQADKKLGANIKAARLGAGFTMKFVGESLREPITYQQIDKYESGQNRVPATVLGEIAVILKVNVGSLLYGINIDEDYAVAFEGIKDANLLRAYAQIESGNVKDALRVFVAALAGEAHAHLTQSKPKA